MFIKTKAPSGTFVLALALQPGYFLRPLQLLIMGNDVSDLNTT